MVLATASALVLLLAVLLFACFGTDALAVLTVHRGWSEVVLLYVKSLSALGRRFSHTFSLQTRTRIRYFFGYQIIDSTKEALTFIFPF